MNQPFKLLLVEDDENLGQLLKEYLDLKGFETTLKRDGEAGLAAFTNDVYDICILDVMMPKKDGYSMAGEMVKVNKSVPFLFVTAKSMKDDVIQGLTLGADDYIKKPFSMEELLLRLNAILRRSHTKNNGDVFEVGNTKLYPERRKLVVNGTERVLTTKENALLRLLYQNKNATLSRKLALEKIWGDDSYFNARSMDVYIAKLRKYLKEDSSIEILTVHGEGFKLVNVG